MEHSEMYSGNGISILAASDGKVVVMDGGVCGKNQRVLAIAAGLIVWALILVTCRSSLAEGDIGTTATAAAAPVATTPNQTIYEVGDVFLGGSRAYVFVGKTGLGHEHGVVGLLKEGRINLAAPRDAGMLVFDMASFAADTPDARKYVGLEGVADASTQQQVDANMQGEYVLDSTKHPTATFVVKQIAKLDKPSQRNLPQYVLTGDFTLHGATRPIQVVADAEEQGGWIHLRGGFKMLQSQWGIKPFTKALGAVGVTDELTIWGDLWIAKQRQMAAKPATTK